MNNIFLTISKEKYTKFNKKYAAFNQPALTITYLRRIQIDWLIFNATVVRLLKSVLL